MTMPHLSLSRHQNAAITFFIRCLSLIRRCRRIIASAAPILLRKEQSRHYATRRAARFRFIYIYLRHRDKYYDWAAGRGMNDEPRLLHFAGLIAFTHRAIRVYLMIMEICRCDFDIPRSPTVGDVKLLKHGTKFKVLH